MSNAETNQGLSRFLSGLMTAARLDNPKDEAFIRALGASHELHELVLREQLRTAQGRAELSKKAKALRAEAADRSVNKSWLKRCDEAVQRQERAREELRLATEALTATRAAFEHFAGEPLKQALLIERDLVQQVDRRVQDFRALLRTLEGRVRSGLQFWFIEVRSGPGGFSSSQQMVTNSAEMDAAMSAINAVYAPLLSPDLAALPFDEVTARLVKYCDELRPHLHAMDLTECIAIDPRTLAPRLVAMQGGQAVLPNDAT